MFVFPFVVVFVGGMIYLGQIVLPVVSYGNEILFLFIALYRILWWGAMFYVIHLQFRTQCVVRAAYLIGISSGLLETVWHILAFIEVSPFVCLSCTNGSELVEYGFYFYYNMFMFVLTVLVTAIYSIFEVRYLHTAAPCLRFCRMGIACLLMCSILFIFLPFSYFQDPWNRVSCSGMIFPYPLFLYDFFRQITFFCLSFGTSRAHVSSSFVNADEYRGTPMECIYRTSGDEMEMDSIHLM
jgi:hypothetical protein